MIRIRTLGRLDYVDALARMRAFTDRRTAATGATGATGEGRAVDDEIWLTEHPPVFTLGLDGNRRSLRAVGDIPVVATERGGQVTYHGPGQVVAYILVDLRRRRIGVRTLVDRIETGVIAALAGFGIDAHRVGGAPGLYVGGPTHRVGDETLASRAADRTARAPVFGSARKIASIGLKISHGCSFHGVAVNGRMDLSPFDRIDPCGYPNLRMTDVYSEARAHSDFDLGDLATQLGEALVKAIDAD